MTAATVRTRFAPSPTGSLHLGNARTALFNFLFARHYQGAFVLRSEDTDRERSDPGLLASIRGDLGWLGITCDEGPDIGGPFGPYRQQERDAHHRQLLDGLLRDDRVYPCYCSREELAEARRRQVAAGQAPRYPGTCAGLSAAERRAREQDGRQPTLRFRVPAQGEVGFDDLVHGRQRFRLADIGDFVIARGDGTPAFLFANAVDDAEMAITHVLRGDDHLANTPRQLLLLEALDRPAPAYGHFGLLTNREGQPLSKRDGAATLGELRDLGYRPEAVCNHLARIGQAGLPTDLLDLRSLAEAFDLARVSRGPAAHDEATLDAWQRRVVDTLDTRDWLAWAESASGHSLDLVADGTAREAFAATVRPNVLLPWEAAQWARRLLDPEYPPDEAAVAEITAAGSALFEHALELDEPDPVADFAAWTKQLAAVAGVRGRGLYRPLRAALTGALAGPDLQGVAQVLGRERLRARLAAAAARARADGHGTQD